MNLQALSIYFAKACASYDYNLHRGRPWCSDTTKETTKTFSLFPYSKACSNTNRWSSGFNERTRGKHANSQTTICSTHIVSCEKCKLNPCLKTIFFFCWHYSPLWPVASRTKPLNFSLSIANSLHLLTPIPFYFFSSYFNGQNRKYIFQKISFQLSVDSGK